MKTTLLFLIILSFAITQSVQAQCMGGLNNTTSQWQSVDPPTIKWQTWCNYCSSCGGIYNCINRSQCPPWLAQWSCNTFFGGPIFTMSDSCYTIPNSIWGQFVVDTPYYWVAKVMNNGQQNYQVCVGPLKRMYAALPPVNPVYPVNIPGVSLTTLLKWDTVQSATSYRVRIYGTQGLSVIVLDTLVTRDSMHVAPGKLVANQTYWWRVKAYKTGGEGPYSDVSTFTTSALGIKQINSSVPLTSSLFQNYPNPFNPLTNIKYQIAKGYDVKLSIYDVLGKEVAVLVNEKQNPGTYEIEFDGSNYPSGIYLYKLTAGEYSATKRMVIVK